ncbi:uncharacterized protein EV422DRAFT_348511 [Fimicolochytrium jonesii]|uniref:uncharacterized protein n=1 Tax=Fimicolochytrium jonesii TaxID=1396493 RepID=UPI0022FE0684|nr:uncharacterized protein EV422DRAFT_348511 [Fimicolochytrium jonesii]KAI8815672.1 hypothetical protein EV422DRAFT_348511 [Fimicolochytrium jonesii]
MLPRRRWTSGLISFVIAQGINISVAQVEQLREKQQRICEGEANGTIGLANQYQPRDIGVPDNLANGVDSVPSHRRELVKDSIFNIAGTNAFGGFARLVTDFIWWRRHWNPGLRSFPG